LPRILEGCDPDGIGKERRCSRRHSGDVALSDAVNQARRVVLSCVEPEIVPRREELDCVAEELKWREKSDDPGTGGARGRTTNWSRWPAN